MHAVALVVFVLGQWALAEEFQKDRQTYCRMSHQNFLGVGRDSRNFIPFTNPAAGIQNGGLCWWHSQFQRNLVYLGVLKPESERLSPAGERGLIKSIMRGNRVVEIPGYESVKEFLAPHKKYLIKLLEKQQLVDGFLKQAWIVGLAGRPKVPARRMAKLMHKLYNHFEEKQRLTYQFLQIKGVDAHAWLVTDIKAVDGGYDLKVIDSNYKEVKDVKYRYGDRNLSINGKTRWVPYTWRERDFWKISRAMKSYCRSEGGSAFSQEESRFKFASGN